MTKKGALLINLGTPDSPSTKDVRKYLREFLSDPRVIDTPALIRWVLLNFFILPFRPRKSAKAYQAIWTADGSPLLVNSDSLINKLKTMLADTHSIELAMRYGNPSIDSALNKLLLAGCDEILIIPLFPQYASATSASSIEYSLKYLIRKNNIPAIKVINDFYADAKFIAAMACVTREFLEDKQSDFYLFSYHGLPVKQIVKSGCDNNGFCDKQHTCPAITHYNRYCYRAQCYETTRLLANDLNIDPMRYTVAFQSRLGKTPWIKPYSDEILYSIIKKGHKNLTVLCPSFVADCLETLEEIGIRLKQQWQDLGGNELYLVPCVNDDPSWVSALADMIMEY